jgi:hypothetical protein
VPSEQEQPTRRRTLISMMSIAVGVQTGLLLWRAAIELTSSSDRRAMHD